MDNDRTRIRYTFGDASFAVYRDSKLHKLCQSLKNEFPGLKMDRKRDLWWHWVAHVLICIFTVGLNLRYIGGFTTSGKGRIAWSDAHWWRLLHGNAQEHDRVWECLMHEREHLRQFKNKGVFVMTLLWVIPPILFCYGRAVIIEKPAYIVSLRCKFVNDREWAESAAYRNWWVNNFTGPAYGWMWILRSQVEEWFDVELKKLQAGEDYGFIRRAR